MLNVAFVVVGLLESNLHEVDRLGRTFIYNAQCRVDVGLLEPNLHEAAGLVHRHTMHDQYHFSS